MAMPSRQKRVVVSEDAAMQPETDKPQREFIVLNRPKIMGTIGLALCFATILISVYSFMRTGLLFGAQAILAFMIGMVIGCALVRALAQTIQTHRVAFFVASVLVFLLYVATIFMTLPYFIPYITACCYGMSIAMLYMFYGEYVAKYLTSKIICTVAASLFIAAVLLLVVVLFNVRVLEYVLPAVSFSLYGVELFAFGLKGMDAPSVDDSKSRSCLVRQSYICTANSSLLLGFCAASIVCCGIWTLVIAAIAAICVTCAVLYVDGRGKGVINEAAFMVAYLPVCSVILVLQLLLVGDMRFVFLIVLMCFTLIPTLSSVAAVCKHISFCNLSGFHIFSIGRLVSLAGLAIGLAMGFASQTSLGSFLSVSPFVFCVCMLLLVNIFVSQFAMRKNFYPETNPLSTEQTLEAIEDDLAARTAMHVYDGAFKPQDEGQLEDAPNHSMFRERCDYVASTYGLSARQSEIMGMLAKGRNGSYITKTLVISSHTAKAHIYNIYQKLGVHSRQELMDLVDNVVLPQEEAAAGERKGK